MGGRGIFAAGRGFNRCQKRRQAPSATASPDMTASR
jgi:hypothetical protein